MTLHIDESKDEESSQDLEKHLNMKLMDVALPHSFPKQHSGEKETDPEEAE